MGEVRTVSQEKPETIRGSRGTDVSQGNSKDSSDNGVGETVVHAVNSLPKKNHNRTGKKAGQLRGIWGIACRC